MLLTEDSMLGSYPRDDDTNNQSEDLYLDSGSSSPQQSSNVVRKGFQISS